MKKILFLVLCFSIISLSACGNNNKTTRPITTEYIYKGDNLNTPFIEIDKESQKKFENAFKTKEINRLKTIDESNYKLENRKDMTTNWQENNTISNVDDYHFWFTCYYKNNDITVVHVERSLKDISGVKKMYYGMEYKICNYSFCVWGRSLQEFSFIVVLKNDSLYELDYAYENSIINDTDVKEIYKHYLDSKFIKFDPMYMPYCTIVD